MHCNHKCSGCGKEDKIQLREIFIGVSYYFMWVALIMFIGCAIYTAVFQYPQYDLVKKCETAFIQENLSTRACYFQYCKTDFMSINITQ